MSLVTESLEHQSLAEPLDIEPSADLRVRTFTSFNDAIAAEWDALVAALNGSLYMTFG